MWFFCLERKVMAFSVEGSTGGCFAVHQVGHLQVRRSAETSGLPLAGNVHVLWYTISPRGRRRLQPLVEGGN